MVKFDISAGVSGTIVSFILGILPRFSPIAKLEIVFWFQIAAFSVSIIVGFLTAIHIYSKLRDRIKLRRGKKKDETIA